MAGNAERAGESLKRRSPGVQARASGNEINFEEEIVMSDISTAVAKSNVIPFRFESKEVRTILIGGEPWFVASDVCEALELAGRSRNFLRMLDEDEKGAHIVSTLGGSQEMQVINESGLYALIFKSRKAEAKRFKKWVTAEVLPAIRKHGRYEDNGKMTTLMDKLIGMSELNVIKGLIRDKAKAVPANMQQSFALTMHNRLHTRFSVPRTELIPAGQFEQACNFIGAYVLEGEFLGKETKHQPNLSFPIEALTARRESMMTIRNGEQAWLDVTLHDLRDIRGDETPCERLLGELKKSGHDIEGCWWELRTYRNKVRELVSFAMGMNRVIEDPHRYAVKPRNAA